jgi:hypothetical protein
MALRGAYISFGRAIPPHRRLDRAMAIVFDEQASPPLGDEYLDRLLSRPEFWALAALRGEEVMGSPRTRCR